MSAWLRLHRRAFVAAMQKLAAQRSVALVSAIVIGIALSLPAGGYAVLESLRVVAGRFAFEPAVSVFMLPEAKRDNAQALEKRLKSDKRILRIRFVPREQALKELKSSESLSAVVSALDHNPLPDAFVVSVRNASPQALEALAGDLRRFDMVGHVQVDAAWAHRLAALTQVGRLVLLLLVGLLACGLIAVTFNTIRLQILTQREEIEVSKLIGATDAFIRRPFFYLGSLQGLGGGAVALGIVYGGLQLLNREVAILAESYGANFRFQFLSLADATALVIFVGALGWTGAFLSVSKYLREIDSK